MLYGYLFLGALQNCKKQLLWLPACNSSAPTGQIFIKFDIFQKSVEKIQVSLKSEEQWVLYLCTFMIISHSVLLRMRNVLDEFVEKIKTHVLCTIIYMYFLNHAIYEIMWKNIVEPDSPQMTIRCMHIACWITKATNAHSDYVIFTVFPSKNDYTNVPQCYSYAYIICLSILF